MRYLTFILFALLTFTACNNPPKVDETPGKLKRYDIRGEVLSFDKKTKIASVKHEEIPGYMSPMTMDFEIRKPEWVWNELAPGVTLTGDLFVDNKNAKYWIEVKGLVASSLPSDTAPKPREDKASVGKDFPSFNLTNQDGEAVSLSDFKGKTLAITFVYSECPLPEFCILMSKNFSDLANEIAADDELKDELRLLSISFDPKRDTPEKLRSYGLGYLGKDSKATDFEVWQLAVGEDEKIKKIAEFVGVRYEVDEKDKTQFSHSLRTVVISPDGKVKDVIAGNDWKPKDLLEIMKK